MDLSLDQIDTIVDEMEEALVKVDAVQESIVKLPTAEMELMRVLEKGREFMLALVKKDREMLRVTFGGECERISRIRAVLETSKFKHIEHKDRLKACFTACEIVEQVLQDFGLGFALHKALDMQSKALKKRLLERNERARARASMRKADPKSKAKATEPVDGVSLPALRQRRARAQPVKTNKKEHFQKNLAAEEWTSGLDVAKVQEIINVTDPKALKALRPNRTESLPLWMIWSCHRAHLNDPSLVKFDFTNRRMPASKIESLIAPKLIQALATNTNIVELKMSNSSLQTAEAVVLADVLKTNSTLKVVNIESNFISPEALELLANGLAENRSVEEFRCDGQRGGTPSRGVCEAFLRAVRQNTKLLKVGLAIPDTSLRNEIDKQIMHNTDLTRRQRQSIKEGVDLSAVSGSMLRSAPASVKQEEDEGSQCGSEWTWETDDEEEEGQPSGQPANEESFVKEESFVNETSFANEESFSNLSEAENGVGAEEQASSQGRDDDAPMAAKVEASEEPAQELSHESAAEVVDVPVSPQPPQPPQQEVSPVVVVQEEAEAAQVSPQDDELPRAKVPLQEEVSPVPVLVEKATIEEDQLAPQDVDVTKTADFVDEASTALIQDVDVTETADLADILSGAVQNTAGPEDVQVPPQDGELPSAKMPPQEGGSPVPVLVVEAAIEEGQLAPEDVNVTKTADFVDEAPVAVTQVATDVDVTNTSDLADAQESTVEDAQLPPGKEVPVAVVEEATVTGHVGVAKTADLADDAPISALQEITTEDDQIPSQKEESPQKKELPHAVIEEAAAEGTHIPPQECDVAAQASTSSVPQVVDQAKPADLSDDGLMTTTEGTASVLPLNEEVLVAETADQADSTSA